MKCSVSFSSATASALLNPVAVALRWTLAVFRSAAAVATAASGRAVTVDMSWLAVSRPVVSVEPVTVTVWLLKVTVPGPHGLLLPSLVMKWAPLESSCPLPSALYSAAQPRL